MIRHLTFIYFCATTIFLHAMREEDNKLCPTDEPLSLKMLTLFVPYHQANAGGQLDVAKTCVTHKHAQTGQVIFSKNTQEFIADIYDCMPFDPVNHIIALYRDYIFYLAREKYIKSYALSSLVQDAYLMKQDYTLLHPSKDCLIASDAYGLLFDYDHKTKKYEEALCHTQLQLKEGDCFSIDEKNGLIFTGEITQTGNKIICGTLYGKKRKTIAKFPNICEDWLLFSVDSARQRLYYVMDKDGKYGCLSYEVDDKHMVTTKPYTDIQLCNNFMKKCTFDQVAHNRNTNVWYFKTKRDLEYYNVDKECAPDSAETNSYEIFSKDDCFTCDSVTNRLVIASGSNISFLDPHTWEKTDMEFDITRTDEPVPKKRKIKRVIDYVDVDTTGRMLLRSREQRCLYILKPQLNYDAMQTAIGNTKTLSEMALMHDILRLPQ